MCGSRNASHKRDRKQNVRQMLGSRSPRKSQRRGAVGKDSRLLAVALG